MSQPAMSQLLAELERLLETPLFLRHAKGVDPTRAGLDLIPVARRIVAATEEAAERVASHQRLDGGLVRVASTAAATGALLDRGLPVFGEAHPNILVQVNTVLGQMLDAAFSGEEYDVVLCRERDVLPEGWQFVPLVEDALVVVAGTAHPLARKASVTLEDLAAATWMQHQATSIARDLFDDLRERLGWTDLRVVHVTSRIPVLTWSMLRDGTLLSLVPSSVIVPWTLAGMLVELASDLEMPLPSVGVHWKPDQSGPAIRQFVQTLTDTLKS